MKWKESRWYSIFNLTCPRCHEGNLFPEHTFYKPGSFSVMHPHCTCCGQSFEPEPGYYYGAMFVSYAISTAIFIAAWVALSVLVGEVTLAMMVVTVLVVVVGLMPLNFRLSRAVWINIFIGYEGPCAAIPPKRPVSSVSSE